MADNDGPHYSDTINPFATLRKACGATWGVFKVGQPELVERGLTQREADERARGRNKNVPHD